MENKKIVVFVRTIVLLGFLLSTASAAYAGPIFIETFDSAGPTFDNPAAWTLSSSTADGRIQVTGAFGTASGAGALLMDTTVNGPVNLNEAILTLDLSSCGANCRLSFLFAEFNDEEDILPLNFMGSFIGDGVSISDDGVNWHTILNATSSPSGIWTPFSVNLSQVAAAAGMVLGSNFQIKFQQYDNFSLTTDGRGYDQIVIQTPEPATLALLGIGFATLGLVRRWNSRV